MTIGAAAECDVVLKAAWVGARHARLEMIAGAHHVIAENGARVLLGGAEVVDAVLHDGDEVQLADASGATLRITYVNPLARRIAAVQHFATPPGTPLLTIGR